MKMSWQRALVLGGGVSGCAAARFLRSLGTQVCVVDQRDFASRQLLESEGVIVRIGEMSDDLLEESDGLVLSPGISPLHPFVQKAKLCIDVISEIDLALMYFTGIVIGITGTNGKSTTTAMMAHLLSQLGIDAVACGNIGLAPCDILREQKKANVWCIELSSYQLEQSRPIKANLVFFTSFSQDHLARHGTLENYFRAKWRLIEHAKGPAIVAPEVISQAHQWGLSLPTFVQEVVSEALDFIPTEHDRLNASFCLQGLKALFPAIGKDQAREALRSFTPLPYRYNIIGRISGNIIVNDSKSTNVDSVLTALKSQRQPCLLLLGGQGKNESFAPILKHVDVIKEIWCFGHEGRSIHEQLHASVSCRLFSSLQQLLDFLCVAKISSPVVFSPGCASFDEFRHFEHRGEFFNQRIQSRLDPS